MLPFPGLSLIVHLFVIFTAKLCIGLRRLFFGKSKRRAAPMKMNTVRRRSPWYFDVVRVGSSLTVIFGMIVITFAFFGVALETAIHTGTDEWQRRAVTDAFFQMIESQQQPYYSDQVETAQGFIKQ